jgi:predicted secreted protein
MQLGTHVFNTRVHVSKASDIRAIMGLQDVRARNTVNAYKACRHAATV